MCLINTSTVENCSKCPFCIEPKFSKKPFKSVVYRSTELLELIYSNLENFKNTTSKGGKKYYILFVDDFYIYTKIYLLSSKINERVVFAFFIDEDPKTYKKAITSIEFDL